MHYGQIHHGLAGEMRRYYGPEWPEHAAILNPRVLEDLELVKLQGYPRLMLFPLYLDVNCYIFCVL